MDKGIRTALGLQSPPRGADLRKNLILTGLFTLLFIVVYGGADILGANAEQRYLVAFDFEAQIPFVPSMALIYLSILPLMLLLPVVFNKPWQLFPLFVVLSLETLVGGVLFLVFPTQEIFPSPESGASTLMFSVADTLNLRYNNLPSLHVALSLTSAIALAQRCDTWGRWFYLGWGTLITVSSVLMHEHHIADVVAGALLAIAGMYVVYPRVSTFAFVRAAQLEFVCLEQFGMFIRRHRRYLVIALFLYGHSLFRWRKTRVLRVGFCLLQAIDDLLDGDRVSECDPVNVAGDIVRQMRSGEFATDQLALLAEALVEDLRVLQTEADDPLSEAIALIQHMCVDRERVEQGLIFDKVQLRQHHRKTFEHSLNLLLIASGARTRAEDIPELIDAFGWCSTVRDLNEDLSHGLVNVPADVVAAAAVEGANPSSVPEFGATEAVRSWFGAELERADSLLEAHNDKWTPGVDPVGDRIVRIFHKSISGYVRKLERNWPMTVSANRPG
jgi:membrane-associated phospholipid phosphatase